MLNFFILVNFVLAIIVNGFTKHREVIERTDVESDILTDTWLTSKRCLYSFWYRWPGIRRTAIDVERLPGMFVSVPWVSLDVPCAFTDGGAAAFSHFYGQMPALTVCPHLAEGVEHSVYSVEGRQNVRWIKTELFQKQLQERDFCNGFPGCIDQASEPSVRTSSSFYSQNGATPIPMCPTRTTCEEDEPIVMV